MKPIQRNREIAWSHFEKCHAGEGILNYKSMLDECDSEKFRFMHYDDIKSGVSIGIHEHPNNEELWYLVSGKGILTYDGAEYEMQAGDVSLCNMGHSHGFLATEDSVLIVIGARQ